MVSRLSIFHPAGGLSLKTNPFGKDVANLELFRALARHGGFEQLDLLSIQSVADAEVVDGLLDGQPSTTRFTAGSILDQARPAAAGSLLRGQADLYDLAWLRRRTVGDRAFSLVGLIHTLAPPFIRQTIAMASVAPTHPWDAIICTSPSVRDAVTRMMADWGGHLAERTGGSAPPEPLLPVIPLGVDGAALAAMADRPEARASRRAELGVGEDDILALWVGRLSFFEKAFPQPMFQALQRATQSTGAKVVFVMAGWFPNAEDRGRYEAAARLHAPDVTTHFLDGNDRTVLGELWAAGDIFMSLVDNIQETFGITPLEAMAAGLPVVASDWDGYRFTVRDGVEGFLIPTLGGPAGGMGPTMVQRHVMGIDSYQAYAGMVAQHTAVNVERAARAVAELIRSPELRRRMGAAGRERVRTAFDWPVVARGYRALLDDLAQIRTRSADPDLRHRDNPAKGDPFADFAGFATQTLSQDTPLFTRPGVTGADVRGMTGVLDGAFSAWRGTREECAEALDLIAAGRGATVRDVLAAFPAPRRRLVEMGLMWMAKLGLIDWIA
jgi:glycosyltransferase involved in cell wall biosynthesis